MPSKKPIKPLSQIKSDIKINNIGARGFTDYNLYSEVVDSVDIVPPVTPKTLNSVLDKIKEEILQLDYDVEDVDYDYNDMAQTEEVHMICREEVLQIIDKYRTERR